MERQRVVDAARTALSEMECSLCRVFVMSNCRDEAECALLSRGMLGVWGEGGARKGNAVLPTGGETGVPVCEVSVKPGVAPSPPRAGTCVWVWPEGQQQCRTSPRPAACVAQSAIQRSAPARACRARVTLASRLPLLSHHQHTRASPPQVGPSGLLHSDPHTIRAPWRGAGNGRSEVGRRADHREPRAGLLRQRAVGRLAAHPPAQAAGPGGWCGETAAVHLR